MTVRNVAHVSLMKLIGIFSFFIKASSGPASLEIRDTRSRIQDHNPRDALRASGFILSLRLSAWHQWHVTEIMDSDICWNAHILHEEWNYKKKLDIRGQKTLRINI